VQAHKVLRFHGAPHTPPSCFAAAVLADRPCICAQECPQSRYMCVCARRLKQEGSTHAQCAEMVNDATPSTLPGAHPNRHQERICLFLAVDRHQPPALL
jgi:hypothetical protein